MAKKRITELSQDEISQTQYANKVLTDYTAKFAIPLYRRGLDGTPDPVGSGFVISKHGRSFLITAGHVYDSNSRENAIFFYTGDSAVSYIEGFFKVSECVSRDEDKIDLAVVMLAYDVNFDKHWAVVDSVDIVCDTFKLDDGRFVFSGYPAGRHKTNKTEKRVDFRCYSWVGGFVPECSYSNVGATKKNNLLIKFKNKHAITVEGVGGYQFPKPDGISGGPVWVALGKRNQRRQLVIDEVKLAGLIIEYHPSHQLMLATSIDRAMEYVDELYDQYGAA
nr:serine protease [Pseudomonas fluorescens]